MGDGCRAAEPVLLVIAINGGRRTRRSDSLGDFQLMGFYDDG